MTKVCPWWLSAIQISQPKHSAFTTVIYLAFPLSASFNKSFALHQLIDYFRVSLLKLIIDCHFKLIRFHQRRSVDCFAVLLWILIAFSIGFNIIIFLS